MYIMKKNAWYLLAIAITLGLVCLMFIIAPNPKEIPDTRTRYTIDSFVVGEKKLYFFYYPAKSVSYITADGANMITLVDGQGKALNTYPSFKPGRFVVNNEINFDGVVIQDTLTGVLYGLSATTSDFEVLGDEDSLSLTQT
jgi:hypothetical protein